MGGKRVHLQQHEQDEVVRLAAQLEKQYGTKLAVAEALGYSKSAWYRISQTGETLRKTLDKIRELAATASPTTNGTRPTEDVLPAQQEPRQVEKTTTPPPRREHSFEWLPRVQELLLEAAAVVENAKVGVPKAFHGPYNQFRSRIEGLLDELLAE